MKTLRTIPLLVFMLLSSSIPSFSQERGFFRRYTTERYLIPSSAIETEDGSFIVAVNDHFAFHVGSGMLVKLSDEGELIGDVPVDDDNAWCEIDNIFHHPKQPKTYIGTGVDILVDDSSTFPSRPYLIHFDDELNISFQERPEWPQEFMDYGSIRHALLHKDQKVFTEYLLRKKRPLGYRRLYTMMTTGGVFERIVEDSTEIYPYGYSAEAVFEYPVSQKIGMLRYWNSVRGNPTHKLFKFNDELMIEPTESEPLNELDRFGDDTLANYDIRFNELSLFSTNATILPLYDTVLLFSLRAYETWYKWEHPDSIYHEHSVVVFKADTLGNMGQFCVIGSWNDTVDVVPPCSICVTDNDATGHKEIYHCCFSQYRELFEVPNTLTVTKLTEDFDILWRKSYTIPDLYLEPKHVMATSDGGCLVVGTVTRGYTIVPPFHGYHDEWFALKLLPDGTVGTDEITVTDDIFFYPNPVKDVLHLHYPEETQPKAIALYDLQGRLVHTQNSGLENLSMAGLAAGQYVMKVALADGKMYTDKVVKE